VLEGAIRSGGMRPDASMSCYESSVERTLSDLCVTNFPGAKAFFLLVKHMAVEAVLLLLA